MESGRTRPAPGTLTSRRRTATRWEIARAAVTLFTEHGVPDTTAEQIAHAAGISLRTFYRYCPTKTDAVVPLLTFGAEHYRSRLASVRSDSLPALRRELRDAVGSALDPVDADSLMDLRVTRPLMRSVLSDPDLLRVWDSVNGDSERALLPVVIGLLPSPDPLAGRLLAAAATHSIRLALETWTAPGADDTAPGVVAAEVFWRLTGWMG